MTRSAAPKPLRPYHRANYHPPRATIRRNWIGALPPWAVESVRVRHGLTRGARARWSLRKSDATGLWLVLDTSGRCGRCETAYRLARDWANAHAPVGAEEGQG